MTRQSVQYNPAVIEDFAERLYLSAGQIVLSSTLGGLVIGGLAGAAAAAAVCASYYLNTYGRVNTDGLLNAAFWGGVVCGAIGAIQGHARGTAKAFSLRLEAQRALCFVEIERNTRRGKAG